jgi:hypothetical protein
MAVDWFNPSHGILWLLKLGNFINQTNHEIDQYNDSINLTHQPLLGRYCLRLSPTEPGTTIRVWMDDAIVCESTESLSGHGPTPQGSEEGLAKGVTGKTKLVKNRGSGRRGRFPVSFWQTKRGT